MAVYLDYNATTPIEPLVLKAINEGYEKFWANPSSNYAIGQDAKIAIEEARSHIAKMLDISEPNDLIFTSGGTESNNLIIYSTLQAFDNEIKSNQNGISLPNNYYQNCFKNAHNIPHIITSDIEHDSISLLLNYLENKGCVLVTRLPINPTSGQINVNDLLNAIQPNTRLITIMLANNETGVIQPIGEICCAVNEYLSTEINNNSNLDLNNNFVGHYETKLKLDRSKIVIHTDAAQAIGKIPVSITKLGVDACTLVGHKFYGPRNGALYFKSETTLLYPVFYGGGQEKGLRPGTQNTAAICGLGMACQLVYKKVELYQAHMLKLTSYLIQKLSDAFPNPNYITFNNLHFLDATPSELKIVGYSKLFAQQGTPLRKLTLLPNTLSISFSAQGWEGIKILNKCKVLMASTGAACHNNRAKTQSSVLVKSGISLASARNAIRLSVGRYTTREEIDRVVADLKEAVLEME